MYKSIAAGLKAVKSCTVYLEDVPQNFKTPSFMVTIYDQNPSRGIDGDPKFKTVWTDPINAQEFAAGLIKHNYRDGWKLVDMPR